MFLLNPESFYWDFAILLLMSSTFCGTIACFVWIQRHPSHHKVASRIKRAHRFHQRLIIRLIGLVCLLGFCVVTYGSFIEPRILVVNRFQLSLPVEQPLKIAVLSDLHVGPYKGKTFMQEVVERTNATLPDIVLLAGDYIYTSDDDIRDLSPLRNLRASMGVYAVMGNHDMGKFSSLSGSPYDLPGKEITLTDYFREMGITVLRNEHERISLDTHYLTIVGIDDMWSNQDDLPAAISDVPENDIVILLSHNPSIVLHPESKRAGLIVSGHTHGGQIRLPFIGALYPLPTELGQAYDQGLFAIDDDTTLAITRGVGESSPRARLLAPPEIMVLEVKKDSTNF